MQPFTHPITMTPGAAIQSGPRRRGVTAASPQACKLTPMRITRTAALSILLALPTAAAPRQARATPSPTPARPVKLAVLMAIDGMNYDRLMQYRPWYVAGLKRLLDEGHDFSATHYRHINTETGPGHSSLGTGAPPRVTGVVSNRWFELGPDGRMRSVNCATQWDTQRVPGTPALFYREVERDGRLYVFAQRAALAAWEASGELGKAILRPGAGPQGATLAFDSEDAITLYNWRHGRPAETFPPRETVTGPGNLRVPTLGDRLVQVRPGARVVSLAAKDRSALFMAGRDARHAVYWYDKDTGRFVTSPVYDPSYPTAGLVKRLVAGFNTRRAGAQLPGRFGLLWKKLPAPTHAALSNLPAPAAGLADYQLPAQGVGFDHDLGRDPAGYFNAVYTSPLVDELLTDLALDVLADAKVGLGRGDTPDLLALSFAAQDVVSHSFGAESEENLETLRRLDLQLGRLFEAFDRLFPPGSVVIGLSADHGFAPIPEAQHARHPEIAGGRLVSSERSTPNFLERLNRLLTDELCLPPGSRPIFGVDGWNLAYDKPALPLRSVAGTCGPAERLVGAEQIDAVLPGVVTRHFAEEISAVYLNAQRARWRDDDPVVEFLRNDFDAERSGDVFLVPRPFVLMHWDPARGSGHGSHHEYDTHVPLIFWGGPFKAGRSSEPTTPYDLAPTLAHLLHVELPDAIGLARVPAIDAQR